MQMGKQWMFFPSNPAPDSDGVKVVSASEVELDWVHTSQQMNVMWSKFFGSYTTRKLVNEQCLQLVWADLLFKHVVIL